MTLNNLYVEALSKSQSSKRRQMGSREESKPRTALAGTHLVSTQRDPSQMDIRWDRDLHALLGSGGSWAWWSSLASKHKPLTLPRDCTSPHAFYYPGLNSFSLDSLAISKANSGSDSVVIYRWPAWGWGVHGSSTEWATFSKALESAPVSQQVLLPADYILLLIAELVVISMRLMQCLALIDKAILETTLGK